MLWSLEDEIKLFHGLMFFKPVGLDRNFQMICLAYRLQVKENLPCSIKSIWEHLSKLYNLEELNESEAIPYPHRPAEFSLPDEFKEIKSLAFPRVSSAAANPDTSATAGLTGRHKSKSALDSTYKTTLLADENPSTPAASSPSISPRSVSSPSSSTAALLQPTKRTRKSLRSAADKDVSMPPPISASSGKGTTGVISHSHRKSIRRQH
ncbi:MRG binding protein [Echinococcus multilocularis]|uniref:MRG binding protein n=1 Tax=Echinococcus multilocularis TaxID=6211 RepID=A0A087VYS8_ECHMU|nr:MRG binding protein [Echinococcus multilocularis]